MDSKDRDFRDALRSLLERGQKLLETEMRSTRTWEEVWSAVRRWDALNRDLIRSWDEAGGYKEQYEAISASTPQYSGEVAKDSEILKKFVKGRLEVLSMIEERAALWKDEKKNSQLDGEGSEREGIRIFIVHGHDTGLLFETKDYFQNTLELPPPIVLFQQPNYGRTVIEKFEECSNGIDAAVVLVTADDFGATRGKTPSGRARQNVIFELGFFLGKFGRRSGRVLVFYKGNVEIPSDLMGIIYLDVSKGVAAVGEEIRRELPRLRKVSAATAQSGFPQAP